MARRQMERLTTTKTTSTAVKVSVAFVLATGIVSLLLAGLSWFFQASTR